MEENKIGRTSYVFYLNYAKDTEKFMRDFRKTDKIFRTGLELIKSERKRAQLEKEYHKFAVRMRKRWENIVKTDKKSSLSPPSSQTPTQFQRRARKQDAPTPIIDRLMVKPLNNYLNIGTQPSREKESSYTQYHTNKNKDCPIFVDSDQRKEIIPEGSLYTDKYYYELQERGIDFRITSAR